MVGGYTIYEVGEGWVAGVDGGEGDEVGWEVSVFMGAAGGDCTFSLLGKNKFLGYN